MALSRTSAYPGLVEEILEDGDDFVVATFRRWLIVVAAGPAGEASVSAFKRGLASLLRDTDGPISVIVYIDKRAPGLTDDERAELSRALRLAGTRVVGLAGVVCATGFVGAVQRSSMAALGVLSRLPCPLRAFSTTSDATRWLDERLSLHHGRPRDGAEVTRIVESLVGRML